MNDFKISPITIMKELGRMIKQYNELPDEDFFYDRLYFMKKNYNNDQNIYKSKDEEDKETILEYDLETINILIQQVLRFGRIPMSDTNGQIYNFDKRPTFEINDIFSKRKQNTIKTNMRKK